MCDGHTKQKLSHAVLDAEQQWMMGAYHTLQNTAFSWTEHNIQGNYL